MSIQFTETPEYYFVRKPHGIPSTFGTQFSFLEKIVHDKPAFLASQMLHFSAEQEYGLLNRLDNDTAGFLYFAKDKNIFDRYKILQAEQKITKIYVARLEGKVDIERTAEKHPELLVHMFSPHVEGNEASHTMISTSGDSSALPQNEESVINYALGIMNISQQESDTIINILKGNVKGLVINYPIMHHTHDDVRMVAIRIPKDEHKGRGEKHYVNTTIYPIADTQDSTLCLIEIHQGIRHQIRVHTSSIGYSVVGDKLYGKKMNDELQLWSIGIL